MKLNSSFVREKRQVQVLHLSLVQDYLISWFIWFSLDWNYAFGIILEIIYEIHSLDLWLFMTFAMLLYIIYATFPLAFPSLYIVQPLILKIPSLHKPTPSCLCFNASVSLILFSLVKCAPQRQAYLPVLCLAVVWNQWFQSHAT